jgi:hypothetical protein
MAGLNALVGDFLVASEGRFFEGDRDLLLQIASLARSDSEPSKQIAEHSFEVDVAEIHEVESARRPSIAGDGRRTEAVEASPLVRIAEDLVGGIDLFEPLLRALVSRVSVGVILLGEPPEGGFHFVGTRRTIEPEDLVGVLHIEVVAQMLGADLGPPPPYRTAQ